MQKEAYYQNIKAKWSSDYPSSNSIEEVWDFYRECGYKEPVVCFKRILNQIEWNKGKLLDFGCDNGLLLNYICNLIPNINGYGIDINDNAIKKAKEAFSGIEFIPFSGTEIPFDDDYFDVIYMSAVLKHIRYEDRDHIYNELRRVANKLFVVEIDSKKQEIISHQGWTFYHSHFEKELAENFIPIDTFNECGDLWGLYKL